MADYSMAVVLSADGTAMIGTFDTATNSMVKLQSASEVLNDALADTGKAGATAAEGIKKSGNEADAARKKWSDLGDVFDKKLALGVKAGIAGIAALVGVQINAADRAGKLAEKLGISTEFISAMGYAADSSGANLNVLTSGLGELSERAVKAAGGNRQSAASFAAIGVSVVDASGKMKSLEQLLPEIADRFAGIENGVGKAALANRLFGSSGQALIPMLNQGSKGLADMKKQAGDLGLVISGETAAAATQLGDNISLLKNNFMGMASTLAERLLPSLVAITSHTDSIVNIVTLLGTVAATVYAGKLVKTALDYGSALADLVIKNQAVATAEGARGAASAAASGLSFKSLGALQSAFLLVQAAVVGWSIGTYLREEFRVVADAGDYLVYGIIQGWDNIKYSTQLLAAYIKAAFVGSLNIVRENLAGLLSMYANAAEKLDAFGLGADAIAKLREWETALRPVTNAHDELTATIKALDAELLADSITNDKMLADMQAATAATHGKTKATKDLTSAFTELDPVIGRVSASTARAIDPVEEHRKAIELLSDEMTVSRDKAELLQLELKILAEREAGNHYEADLLTRAYEARVLAMEGVTEASTSYASIVGDLNASYDQEIRLAGLSNEQRVIEEQLLRAVGDAKRDGVNLTEDEQDALRGLISTREQHLQAVQRERQIIEANQNVVRDGFYALTDAATAFANGSIRSFKDQARQGLDIIKRMVVDMLANVFKMRVVEPFLRNLFAGGGNSGGSGWGAMLGSFFGGGSGGSGNGNIMGGLLSLASGSAGASGGQGSNPWLSLVSGATGTNGNLLSSLSSFFGGGGAATPINSVGPLANGYAYPASGGSAGSALGPWGTAAAGIGGAIYGYNRTNGGAPGVAAGIAYGAAGIGIAGTAAGLAGGATLGAAAGGAFSAFGAAAAIPVVGWIIAALAFIDLASGGRLFGTKFRPESATQSLTIGADGGDATATLRQVRQRSLFRGRKWDTDVLDPGAEAEGAADRLYEAAHDINEAVARTFGVDIPEVIDASIRTFTEYTKKGKVKSEKIFVDIGGRSWEVKDGEEAATRVMAESWISALDAAAREIEARATPVVSNEAMAKLLGLDGSGIGDRIGVIQPDGGSRGGGPGDGIGGAQGTSLTDGQSEIQRLAERWRADSQKLMEGAQFLFAAFEANRRGLGLLGESGTLTQITDLTEDMQRGEETMSETFVRILSNTELYRAALDQMGKTLDVGGTAFVELATRIVDSAGGLQQAQQMWQAYFEGFYTAAERAEFQRDAVMSSFGTQAEELGLDTNMTAAQFRAAFEQALPRLTGDEVVAWQRFGQVLLQVAAARDAVTQAEVAHGQWTMQLTDEITGHVESGYQQAVRAIRNATAQHIANADTLAQAQGREGASTADLALIHRWAARQIQLATQALEAVATDLAAQLGYGALQQIEEQIATLEAAAEGSGSAIADAGLAAENFFQSFADGLDSLNDYFDSLLIGDLSPLSPEDQIAEARRQLEANAAAARGGDVNALQQSQGLIETFLRLIRGHEASGDDYTQQFNWAQGLFAGINNPYSPGGSGGMGPVELVPSPALEALYLQRDAALADAEAERRAALAAELAARIAELINATGQSLAAIAARVGVPLDLLVHDLTGLNLGVDELTASVVQQLGGVANQVGVELSDLAQALGIELGALTSANSLLNDGLELVIAGLPEEFRNQLEPLLRDVESASSPAEQLEALGELERVTGSLPEELRLLLAPYLNNVDPLDPGLFTDLDYLSSVDANTARANELLLGIYDAITGGASIDDPPVDDPTVVAPGTTALASASLLTSVGGVGQAQSAMLVELQQLRKEVVMLADRLERSTNATTSAVKENAQQVSQRGEDSMRRLGDDIRSSARSASR